jgi:hypothetical protein
MIPPEKIEEILSATDIASLVSRYVTLKPSGKNLKDCVRSTTKKPHLSWYILTRVSINALAVVKEAEQSSS